MKGIQLIFFKPSKPIAQTEFVNQRDSGSRVYVNADSHVDALEVGREVRGTAAETVEGIVKEGEERYNEETRNLKNAVVSKGLEETAKLADNVTLNNANRIDYSYSFKSEEVNFKPGFQDFNTIQKDMTIVQFHSRNALGDGRSVKYWTTMEQAKQFKSIENAKEYLALLDEWGTRDTVSIAIIPAGTKVNYKVGKAISQTSAKTGQVVGGNGTQVLFNEFNPDWITEVKYSSEFFK